MEKILSKKIIFGKYKVLNLLAKGSYGYIFKGKNITTNEFIALKVEDYKGKVSLLESEAFLLYNLKGFGIPGIITFGVYKKYKILVETLLGNNLETLFVKTTIDLNFKDICMVAIQLLDRLEFIHSRYIIHRDLKPENILVDLETESIIYLIDFGLSKKYRSGKTKKHIKFSMTGKLTGTARFCSINANRGVQQSRRDDLESVGYILIYLAQRGYLPWMGLNISDKILKYIQIYKMKKSIKDEILCKNLPKAFCDYIKYVKNLNFEEDPDYNYLRSLFLNLLISYNCLNNHQFTWNLRTKKKSKNNITPCLKRKYSFLKKKSIPQTRLLRNIKNSQEKDKKEKIKEKEKLMNISKDKQDKKDDKNDPNNETSINQKDDMNIIQQLPEVNKNNKNNNSSEEGTKVAQFNMDIPIYDSDDFNLKEYDEKRMNTDREKNNIEEYKDKNQIFKKFEERNKNNLAITENNTYKGIGIYGHLNNSLKDNIGMINISPVEKNIIKQDKKINNFNLNLSTYLDFYQKNSQTSITNIASLTNLKSYINNIPENTNETKIINVKTNYIKPASNNILKKFSIPKQITPYKKDNYYFIKQMILDKKKKLKNIFHNKIKYNTSNNNLNNFEDKTNAKRYQINYNKTNIKHSKSERRLDFNQKEQEIKTYSYKKLYIFSEPEMEINNNINFLKNKKIHFRSANCSPNKYIRSYNSDYQSNKNVKIRLSKNNDNENKNSVINKINLIPKGKRGDNIMLKLNFIQTNDDQKNNKKKNIIPYNKNATKFIFKNIKYKKRIKFKSQRANNFNLNKTDINQKYIINNKISNIDIKQNYISPVNFYLNNFINYERDNLDNGNNFMNNKY